MGWGRLGTIIKYSRMCVSSHPEEAGAFTHSFLSRLSEHLLCENLGHGNAPSSDKDSLCS